MKVKNKKSIIAIAALILVVVVGTTFAYLRSSAVFANLFQAGIYRLVTTEVFESPSDWRPGQTIEKRIFTSNEGTIPAAVRVSYTEQWLDEDDNDITSSIGEGIAIINFDNQEDWIEEDGYYYYKYTLYPEETTSSFISGVTLNQSLDEVTCTTEGLTQDCEAQNPALGERYILTIKRETVQHSAYHEVWTTEVDITDRPNEITIISGEEGGLQPGDVVGIGETEDFYVLSSDNSPTGKTKLVAKHGLLISNYDPDDPGFGLQNVIAGRYAGSQDYPGGIVFSTSGYWMDGDYVNSKYNPDDRIIQLNRHGSSSRLYWDLTYTNGTKTYPYVYDENSIIYDYISGENGYVNRLISMGAPSTITGRLLTYEEALELISMQLTDGLHEIGNRSFWTGTASDSSSLWVFSIQDDGTKQMFPKVDYNDDFSTIRPVIEVPTREIRQ